MKIRCACSDKSNVDFSGAACTTSIVRPKPPNPVHMPISQLLQRAAAPPPSPAAAPKQGTMCANTRRVLRRTCACVAPCTHTHTAHAHAWAAMQGLFEADSRIIAHCLVARPNCCQRPCHGLVVCSLQVRRSPQQA